MEAFRPDQQFRKRDPRFATATRHKPERKQFSKEDFIYNPPTDTFAYPNVKTFTLECYQNNLGNSLGREYHAQQADCSECKIQEKCLRKPTSWRCYFFIAERQHSRSYSKAMIQSIDNLEGREIYSQRMNIVEPMFANIKNQRTHDRLSLEEKSKYTVAVVLYPT